MTVAKYSCSGAHSIHTDIVENIKEEFKKSAESVYPEIERQSGSEIYRAYLDTRKDTRG